MNITVYCGAALGDDPAFEQAARDLGTWIAREGHALVWGGGATGLMGAVCGACLEAGGSATGIIPQFLLELERPPAGFGNLEVTQTMAERRTRMIELGDAFVALPGGPGTFEELTEVMSLVKLRVIDKPLVLVNVNGYFDDVFDAYRSAAAHGFMAPEALELLHNVTTTEELTAFLSAHAQELPR